MGNLTDLYIILKNRGGHTVRRHFVQYLINISMGYFTKNVISIIFLKKIILFEIIINTNSVLFFNLPISYQIFDMYSLYVKQFLNKQTNLKYYILCKIFCNTSSKLLLFRLPWRVCLIKLEIFKRFGKQRCAIL